MMQKKTHTNNNHATIEMKCRGFIQFSDWILSRSAMCANNFAQVMEFHHSKIAQCRILIKSFLSLSCSQCCHHRQDSYDRARLTARNWWPSKVNCVWTARDAWVLKFTALVQWDSDWEIVVAHNFLSSKSELLAVKNSNVPHWTSQGATLVPCANKFVGKFGKLSSTVEEWAFWPATAKWPLLTFCAKDFECKVHLNCHW